MNWNIDRVCSLAGCAFFITLTLLAAPGCSSMKVGGPKPDAMGTDALINLIENPETWYKERSIDELKERRLTNGQVDRLIELIPTNRSVYIQKQIMLAVDAEVNRRHDDKFSGAVMEKMYGLRHELKDENNTLALLDILQSHIVNVDDRYAFNADLFMNSPFPEVRYEALDRMIDECFTQDLHKEDILGVALERLRVETYASVAKYCCDILGTAAYQPALSLLEQIANDPNPERFKSSRTRQRTLADGRDLASVSFNDQGVKMAAVQAVEAIRTEHKIFD